MAVNRGKDFEHVIRKSFERVEGVSIDRINDNTSGFKGVAGICDFIVYKYPFEYYFECKSVHGNLLSIYSKDKIHNREVYGNITSTQWKGLLDKSKIRGVFAGIVCWWIDKDVTKFIPIVELNKYREQGNKSVRFDADIPNQVILKGEKKRVFFDYDIKQLLIDITNNNLTKGISV